MSIPVFSLLNILGGLCTCMHVEYGGSISHICVCGKAEGQRPMSYSLDCSPPELFESVLYGVLDSVIGH